MLLFTLLSTLFFGSPGAPAKDSLPVVKPRASIGLFYMTGPRAYGSTGFLGLEGHFPLTSSFTASLALAGNYHYQIDNRPKIVISIPEELGGNTTALSTLRITRAYFFSSSLYRSIRLTNKISFTGGVSMGYSQIYSSFEYDALPKRIPNDTSTVNGVWSYSHQRSRYQDINIWIGPRMSVSYEFTNQLSLDFGGVFGFQRHLVRESFSNVDYLLGPEYGFTDRFITDPFNFNGVRRWIIGGGSGFALDGSLPNSYKATNLFGFASVKVDLRCTL